MTEPARKPGRPRKTPAVEAAPDTTGRLYLLQQEVELPQPYVLNSEITIKPPSHAQMRDLKAAKTDAESNRVILGDQFEAVEALFKERPFQLWEAFWADIAKQFLGPGADDVEGKSQDSSES